MSDRKDWELRILHIRDEIKNLRIFAGTLDKDQLSQDKKTVYALIRSFQIIGEATKKVPDEIRAMYPSIPWRRMAGLRDVLVHGYDDVDIDTVHNVITKELDSLEHEILQIKLSGDFIQ